MNKPRTVREAIKHRRKLAAGLNAEAGRSSLVSIGQIKHRGMGNDTLAIVSTNGTRGGFYSPAHAIACQISEALDPKNIPAKCIKLDPSSVEVTNIKDIHHGSKFGTLKMAMRRIPKSEKFIRVWHSPYKNGKATGWFFLFPDKVLHIQYVKGWRHRVVPESGIDLAEL